MNKKILLITIFNLLLLISCSNNRLRFSSNETLETLNDLTFREFVNQSYLHIISCYPEDVIINGLDSEITYEKNRLNSFDIVYIKEVRQLVEGICLILKSYDINNLDVEERIYYRAYLHYLELWEEDWEYLYHFYYLSYSNNYSINFSIENFFNRLHLLHQEKKLKITLIVYGS